MLAHLQRGPQIAAKPGFYEGKFFGASAGAILSTPPLPLP